MKIDKELNYLFIANIYLNAYIENADRPLPLSAKLLDKVNKIGRLFKSRVDSVIKVSNELMIKAEAQAKANRFSKVKLDNENDFTVHPLSLALELILAHKTVKNKSLNLPYKDALLLKNELDKTEHYALKNSRLVANSYVCLNV